MVIRTSDMQSNTRDKSLTKREQLIRKKMEFPDYSDKTAWVLGAGPTLLDIWDWHVPDNVIVFTMNSSILWAWKHWNGNNPTGMIMKGNELHSLDDYTKPVHYWFARDNAVFTPTLEPEKWYCQVAMRHPSLIKIVEHHNPINENMPNVYLVQCQRDWQRYLNLNLPHNNAIMGGPTVLLAALQFVYRCKFKRVVLSGVDFCRYKVQNQSSDIRRYLDLKGVKKNHEMNERACNAHNEIKDTSGAIVYQCGMMRNHMNAGNSMIKAMKDKGIFFCKTSKRGMAYMPYIESEKQLSLIAKGAEIKYNK